ncbi:MAG: hypothetical protein AB7R40_25295 [Nitrospiraceae bacterium]
MRTKPVTFRLDPEAAAILEQQCGTGADGRKYLGAGKIVSRLLIRDQAKKEAHGQRGEKAVPVPA